MRWAAFAGIERHFGITRGHIHHVDNSFCFDQRFPYATPISGLYSASAGCHPAGSVMGIDRLLPDLYHLLSLASMLVVFFWR